MIPELFAPMVNEVNKNAANMFTPQLTPLLWFAVSIILSYGLKKKYNSDGLALFILMTFVFFGFLSYLGLK